MNERYIGGGIQIEVDHGDGHYATVSETYDALAAYYDLIDAMTESIYVKNVEDGPHSLTEHDLSMLKTLDNAKKTAAAHAFKIVSESLDRSTT